MSTYKLLEQKITGKYYLKIESSFPSQIFAASVSRIILNESFSAGTTLMEISFLDAVGSLINGMFLTPEVEYTTTFGLDDQNASQCGFQLSANRAETVTGGKIQDVATSASFMGTNWPNMLNQTHSRSWAAAKYSDVVKAIAQECGFTDLDIEETSGTFDVIQPGWQNYKMLEWVAEHAVNASNVPGYDMVVTIDGAFRFKTYNAFFQSPLVRNLYLFGQNPTNANIYDVHFTQNYAPTMNAGGGFGVHHMYYDYDSGEFVVDDMDISQSSQSQLSDWFFMPAAHLNPTSRMYGARDANVAQVAEKKIASTINTVNNLKFSMLGDTNLHAGDVVNLVLSTNTLFKNPINEFYSGYWLIAAVSQIIDVQAASFTSQLTLVRAGFNGTGITNLVKSPMGKVLAPNPNSGAGSTI